MEKWSGQVVYAALAITIGGGLCGMSKDTVAPIAPGRVLTQNLQSFDGPIAPKIILPSPEKDRSMALAGR